MLSRIRESDLYGISDMIALILRMRCAPGMMYVKERSADSICDTALLFLVMNSEYIPSHSCGSDKTAVVFWVACLYMVVAPMDGCSGPTCRAASGDVEM